MLTLFAYIIAISKLFGKYLLAFSLMVIVLFIFYANVEQSDRQTVLLQKTSESSGFFVEKAAASIDGKFTALAELKAAERIAGFLPVGFFGNSWPASVTEILTGNDGISFVRQGGTRHTYNGFDGYRMKVVRLMDGSQREVIVVFRSVEKR